MKDGAVYFVAILWITIKRLVKNWRVTAGLLGGLVLASGIMAAISIYGAGSLQQSFWREWFEKDSFRPPFSLILSSTNDRRANDVRCADLARLETSLDAELRRRVRRPVLSFVQFASLGTCPLLAAGGSEPTLASGSMEISSMSNLEKVATIVSGRWYAPRSDGVVEIVVDENTLEKSELLVGQRFDVWYELQQGESVAGAVEGVAIIPVEIVGFFEAKPGFTTKDWIYPPPYVDRGFAHPDVLRGQLMAVQGLRAERFDLFWVFEPEGVKVASLGGLIAGLEAAEKRAARIVPGTSFWLSPLDFFRQFTGKARDVSLFLFSLAVPVMGAILFFIVLMAGMAVDHRRKEIVILYSRGAGRLQAIVSFFLEWLTLGGIALAAGPAVGLVIAKSMGASAGFLSFVDREAIPVAIGGQAWLFSLAASLIAVAAGMAPVFTTVRQTIVTYTSGKRRKNRAFLLHRLFLDVILLALAAVASRELSWQSVKLAADETIAADPLLFFVPVLFLLGSGLLLLRLYPLALAGLRRIAGRLPGVTWQLTLRRLTRTASQYFPLLLLLILTLSLGVFSASAARTLALNFEDRIRYEVGADLAVKEAWKPPQAAGTSEVVSEPPFLKRLELPGVLSAARVLKGGVYATVGGTWSPATSGTMMAIAPEEFARTAWFRSDFAAAPFSDYLALLSRHREGMLVSRGYFEEEGLSLGDPVILEFDGQRIEGYVAGTVSYWPSLDPLQKPFFVLNLDHVQDFTKLQPYEVWYRLDDHDRVQELLDLLPGIGVYPLAVDDAEARIVSLRREPYRMGFFGILSLGFLVSSLVTVLGFLVHTYFSIRGRIVQFGSLRAMGFSGIQLVAHLGLEQLLTLGPGLGIGAGLGFLCAQVFLPFLRDRASELQKVPPFLIVTSREDALVPLAVLAALFSIAVMVLAFILARMRVNRAVQQGEDA